MNSLWRKYVLWFAQEHLDFRFAEIESLTSLLKISMRFLEEPTPLQPYWLVEFTSENDVKLLASRSVSLRSCMELWSHATNIQALHESLKKYPVHLITPHLQPDKTFKIEVETFCKHLTQKQKLDKLEAFDYLPFRGEVKLTEPDTCLQYIEYYGVEANDPPEQPYELFFGRWIANGLRQMIRKLSLKTRKFIGNTSMDPQLSLLMANQAQVKSGDLVLDPFVGSGSLLVPVAQFGGYVLGTDIDFLMLHGKSRPSRITQQTRELDESVQANMKQYNLEHKYVDVLINDFTTVFWKDDLKFDAIITDPPYGIREATEKIGIRKKNYTISEKHLSTHIPAKVEYGISQIYFDLLTFAVKHLKLGGRLVCWFPVCRDDYTSEDLPTHAALRLVAKSEQILSKYTSRRLLTYEKITEPEDLEHVNGENRIPDFREKYFQLRDETRQERRTKKALVREQNRLEALKLGKIIKE